MHLHFRYWLSGLLVAVGLVGCLASTKIADAPGRLSHLYLDVAP